MNINKYKKKLLKEKEKLDGLIIEMQDNTLFGDTTKHTSEKYSSGELSSYDNHIADIATDVFMQDMQNSLTTHEKGKLYQVNLALDKIENGTYGICDMCKKNIDEDRLDIVPETNVCSNCAKKHDNLPLDNENMDQNFINRGCDFYSQDLKNLTDINKNGLYDD
ncbi:transcriptional regulator [Romboutsia maritimum]|uniref:Transcriptional regulator n=1 Tax=Romboutsia maritimum TaxID=2020948 RepID=A0A371IWN8_9FIRM|nr:TraR/DksA C4-type zinc finger protein [Romboutsia maritimum]RDY24896.1 transcriptional regulator [Romboutsia maritimum]